MGVRKNHQKRQQNTDYSRNMKLLDALGTVQNSEGAEVKGGFYSQEHGI